MMVSKVAVIALVAIVACPILLGYGLNLNETTKTGYEYSGDPLNLTNMLINGSKGSSYSYAHGDMNQMNTSFNFTGSYKRMPHYENITTQYTTYAMFQDEIVNQTYSGYSIDLTKYNKFYLEFPDKNVQISMYKTVGGVEQSAGVINSSYTFYYEYTSSARVYTSSNYSSELVNANVYTDNITRIALDSGGVSVNGYMTYHYRNGLTPPMPNDNYVDFSAGYYLDATYRNRLAQEQWPSIRLPDCTRQFTITLNLDSITDPNYALHINLAPDQVRMMSLPYSNLSMELAKTTTNGVATWTLRNESDASAPVTELITDSEISSNTYQFTIYPECIYDETSQKYYLAFNVKATYVGKWPTLVGIANPYKTYNLQYVVRDNANFIFNDPLTEDDLLYYNILMSADNAARTPTMRVDDALFRAFEYKTITDRTFSPSLYKENPGVTISKIKIFGSSIEFGGIKYAVTDGKINVNGQAVKLNNCTFNSVLNENNTYDNKINGKTVSTTATILNMAFNGSWAMNVSVQSMESFTYTATEWTPGQFGWDGIDTNFLMVGLLTSLGVFIALGIYIRRTRAALWPLLIVCGGAAALFFIMI